MRHDIKNKSQINKKDVVIVNNKKLKWEEFENDCVIYLTNKYKDKNVLFKKIGGKNSYSSDIKVISKENNKTLFFIEVKMTKAQCGQFALKLESDRFVFSSLNKSILNIYSEEIIQYINSNFERYKDVLQSSIEIDLPENILINWVLNHYRELNTKYIITGTKNEKVLIPIEDINKYFTITANLRRKKSGSRKVPKKDFANIKSFLLENNPNVKAFGYINKTLMVEFINPIEKDYRFNINGDNYYIQASSSNHCIVKKLSNTNNPNVIFSLKLKDI